MITNLREPLRLPASAIPDGTVRWRGERVRQWTGGAARAGCRCGCGWCM
ncbi:hypothetical protein ACRAWF_36560 [Streptomyces sp. L7]